MDHRFGGHATHRQVFDTYHTIVAKKVFMGNDGMVEAVGMGSIVVEIDVKSKLQRIRFKDVLHMPKLHANLLSVSKLVSGGLKVHFSMMGCVVRAAHIKMLATTSREGNLYQVVCKKVNVVEVATLAHSSPNDESLELWHRRLGHLNVKSVKAFQTMVSGMNLGKLLCDVVALTCEGCIEGKQTRQPFPSNGATRTTKILEVVHSDVCGPMRTVSTGGARYCVTFIDDFSRNVWVYELKSKSEVMEKFKA